MNIHGRKNIREDRTIKKTPNREQRQNCPCDLYHNNYVTWEGEGVLLSLEADIRQ